MSFDLKVIISADRELGISEVALGIPALLRYCSGFLICEPHRTTVELTVKRSLVAQIPLQKLIRGLLCGASSLGEIIAFSVDTRGIYIFCSVEELICLVLEPSENDRDDWFSGSSDLPDGILDIRSFAVSLAGLCFPNFNGRVHVAL